MKYRIAHEDENTIVVQHADGSRMELPKALLHAYDLEGIRQFAQGGQMDAPVALPHDEDQRAEEPPTTIAARYHYRYLAANLAWEAAALMPDNNDDTARVLCEAGTWLKNRDPKSADRFYKALVKRCGTTELGKAADKKHWFPPITDPANTKNNP